MKDCITFVAEMVALTGLVFMLVEWRQQQYLRGFGWLMLSVIFAATLIAVPQHTSLNYMGACAGVYGAMQFPGFVWFPWVPGIAERWVQACGRFFLSFALACGLAAVSELYVLHETVVFWSREDYSFLTLCMTTFLFICGLVFLLLDRSMEVEELKASAAKS